MPNVLSFNRSLEITEILNLYELVQKYIASYLLYANQFVLVHLWANSNATCLAVLTKLKRNGDIDHHSN